MVRITAMGDLHCTKASQGAFQPLFAQITKVSDVLVLCGDLANTGLPSEARVLTKELGGIGKIPIIAVLGNTTAVFFW